MHETLAILKQLPFFDSLSIEDASSLYEHIKLHYFPADYVIFKEGDLPQHLYIIKRGAVKIYHDQGSYEEFVAVLRDNDFFGEMALVSSKPRNASVKTLEESEIFLIHKNNLNAILDTKPEIAENIKRTFLNRSI